MSHLSRSKNFVHTCLPRVQSCLGYKVKHTRRLAIVGPSVDGEYFVLYLQPYAALLSHSRSSSIWDKTSQPHLASTAVAVLPN